MAKAIGQEERLKMSRKKLRFSRGIIKKEFPECLGMFPECSKYTADMNIDDRPDCKICPFKEEK